MNVGFKTSVSSQFSIDRNGDLIVHPTSLLPYLIGTSGLALGTLVVFAYFSAPKAEALVWFLIAIALFFGGGIGFTVTRLAGFPRLRVSGQMLSREHYFTRHTATDLSQLGQAMAFSWRRSTYIGFPKVEEEYALHMTGRRHEIDKFNAAQVVDVTSMVGLNLRSAKRIAREINRHRSRAPRPNLEYEQIRTIVTTTARKRAWAVAVTLVIGVVGAVVARLLG